MSESKSVSTAISTGSSSKKVCICARPQLARASHVSCGPKTRPHTTASSPSTTNTAHTSSHEIAMRTRGGRVVARPMAAACLRQPDRRANLRVIAFYTMPSYQSTSAASVMPASSPPPPSSRARAARRRRESVKPRSRISTPSSAVVSTPESSLPHLPNVARSFCSTAFDKLCGTLLRSNRLWRRSSSVKNASDGGDRQQYRMADVVSA
ncbi:hypothetical protein T492DRAFT_1101912 [Pavlovales sp. CCMP2436]|nr:hypothetical protein T492DRAFT_1101912 [Pavlovales sp. CCMP2436]|mmetsp:Transcript_27532/g.69452  ORF Transcript_27532/g.69452 Transcript_27532/m.69452 type:complete len:209 (+) Transcript_27532:241-867(+)